MHIDLRRPAEQVKKRTAPYKWRHAGLEDLSTFLLAEIQHGRFKPTFPFEFGAFNYSLVTLVAIKLARVPNVNSISGEFLPDRNRGQKAAPVPTPCRVRRKLSFMSGSASKSTLKLGESHESLSTVERAAVFNRATTAEKITPKPKPPPETPKSTPTPVQKTIQKTKTPSPKAQQSSNQKRSKDSPPTTPSAMPSRPSERTQKYLAERKRLRRMNTEECKPKQEAPEATPSAAKENGKGTAKKPSSKASTGSRTAPKENKKVNKTSNTTNKGDAKGSKRSVEDAKDTNKKSKEDAKDTNKKSKEDAKDTNKKSKEDAKVDTNKKSKQDAKAKDKKESKEGSTSAKNQGKKKTKGTKEVKRRKHAKGKNTGASSSKVKKEKKDSKAATADVDEESADSKDTGSPKKAKKSKAAKKAHAMYMKYWRSIRSKTQQSVLYEDFWASGCEWQRTTVYRTVTNKMENKKSGKRKWLTRGQMLPYFENDEAIVDAIIHRKMADDELRAEEVRSHPEIPSVYQYLTLVEDEEEATESSSIMDMFKATESKNTGRGRGHESDSSDSEDSDESDGSESGSDSESTDSNSSEGKKRSKKDKKKKDKKKDKKKKDKSKKKGKGGKSNKSKGEAEEAAEQAKEARKDLIKSSGIKTAVVSEIDAMVSRLSKIRLKMQAALDAGAEELWDSRLTNVLTEAEKGLENFDEQMEPITGKKRKAGKGDK
ncbi:unnamed protein product [Durusdinium trenchii]|uniref:Uncharacterized protein n=1 Tax=Durusdinium trenchii TaxID=1381693 RepID=A0ABP0P0Z6_9DINO